MSSSPASTLICFGHVHHARLRPVHHAFRYRSYFLRLPLRSLGNPAAGVHLFSHNRWNLLSFHDADHGDGVQKPVDWIDDLLHREGIHDATGEVWLQTFPRVLGYVFNPVSFWFCHCADGSLRAILCEVNNTFGERHCYLLEHGAPITDDSEICARKVFHVSPFCAVDGEYRFRFLQKRRTANRNEEHFMAKVDLETKDGPLLRTSIVGTAQVLSDRSAFKAFAAYPLMTLAVVVRIHWQALRLWVKRVPFFNKPVSPPASFSE